MAMRDKSNSQRQPVVDEWGVYDPDKAGLAAVLDRLSTRTAENSVPCHLSTIGSMLRPVNKTPKK